MKPISFAQAWTIALSMTALTAHAEFKDGNNLLNQIKGDTYDYVHAVGYITGVSDATRGVTHCPPSNVSAGQITDMVRLHLESVPSVRHLTADTHVTYVLKKAWPCAEQKKNGTSTL